MTIFNETHLPITVFCLVHLQSLTVIRAPFVPQYELDDEYLMNTIPSYIGRLTRLQTLSLNSFPAISFPSAALALLTNLRTFQIINCGLLQLPSTVASLTSLVTLSLSNNRLTSIPDTIGALNKTLITLDLSNNAIRILPDSIGNLGSLSSVTVSNNPLLSLVPFSGLSKLVSLNAMNCQVNSLPSNLTMLRNLYLQFNNISDIMNLHDLKSNQLSILNLAYNQFDTVPAQIQQFAATLTDLQINNNKLFYLPNNMYALTRLQRANIANNLFPPDELTTIRNLFRTRLPGCILTYQ